MRKSAKIPTTQKSIELNVKKVRKFCTADDGSLDIDLAIRTIEQSISEGWRGIFEPRNEHKQIIKPKPQQKDKPLENSQGRFKNLPKDLYDSLRKRGVIDDEENLDYGELSEEEIAEINKYEV
jgi:hypothetical protein